MYECLICHKPLNKNASGRMTCHSACRIALKLEWEKMKQEIMLFKRSQMLQRVVADKDIKYKY